ncbi:MAG: hypothetical protein JWQ14_2783 [Adhaeribacter sp.]|nr:hypothetical protein [Adhaeribacter sp.]
MFDIRLFDVRIANNIILNIYYSSTQNYIILNNCLPLLQDNCGFKI